MKKGRSVIAVLRAILYNIGKQEDNGHPMLPESPYTFPQADSVPVCGYFLFYGFFLFGIDGTF